MRRQFLFFLLSPLVLFGDAFQFTSGIGYRRDEAKMDLSSGPRVFYSSTDLLNSLELEGTMRILASQIFFSLEADVGWVVSGSGQNALSIEPPSMPVSKGRFNQSLGGFFTDAEMHLGTAFGTGRFQLVPQAGFGVFYQEVKYGESSLVSSAPMTCDLSHSRLKRCWFGPSVGGDLHFCPHFAWMFGVGYFYYFLHFDQKFDLFSDLSYSGAEYFIWQQYRASLSAHGQKLSGTISAQVAIDWRFNLRFDAYLFSSEEKNSSLRQNFEQVFPMESAFSTIDSLKTKASWQAYLALVEIEYFF